MSAELARWWIRPALPVGFPTTHPPLVATTDNEQPAAKVSAELAQWWIRPASPVGLPATHPLLAATKRSTGRTPTSPLAPPSFISRKWTSAVRAASTQESPAVTTDSKLKVLVIDDSAIYRKIVRDVLGTLPDVEIIGIARDGKEALIQLELLQPDVATLDVEMPGLNGLDVLRELPKRSPKTKAIMVSSLTSEGAEATMQAMQLGAFDFVTKPVGSTPAQSAALLGQALKEKLDALRLSTRLRFAMPRRIVTPNQSASPFAGAAVSSQLSLSGRRRTGCYAAVALGVSTGGPDALRQLLPLLPATFPLPILIVQHMPPVFTKSFADMLNAKCQLRVKEGENGDLVKAGQVFIAPGGRQMKVSHAGGRTRIQITDDEPECNCRPAVDYLFRSVAEVYGSESLAVIMTGMGHDGTAGLRMIKRVGGAIIAQDAESCVVWGMPRTITEEGLADSVVPLSKLAEELQVFAGEPALV